MQKFILKVDPPWKMIGQAADIWGNKAWEHRYHTLQWYKNGHIRFMDMTQVSKSVSVNEFVEVHVTAWISWGGETTNLKNLWILGSLEQKNLDLTWLSKEGRLLNIHQSNPYQVLVTVGGSPYTINFQTVGMLVQQPPFYIVSINKQSYRGKGWPWAAY